MTVAQALALYKEPPPDNGEPEPEDVAAGRILAGTVMNLRCAMTRAQQMYYQGRNVAAHAIIRDALDEIK